jgi:hypothetical protein
MKKKYKILEDLSWIKKDYKSFPTHIIYKIGANGSECMSKAFDEEPKNAMLDQYNLIWAH